MVLLRDSNTEDSVHQYSVTLLNKSPNSADTFYNSSVSGVTRLVSQAALRGGKAVVVSSWECALSLPRFAADGTEAQCKVGQDGDNLENDGICEHVGSWLE